MADKRSSAQIGVSRGITRIGWFSDAEMDFQLIRSIGADFYGGGTVGECMAAVSRVDDEDPLSWALEFAELGGDLEEDAHVRLGKGHLISARDTFLRASNYYRAAELYSDPRTSAPRDFGIKSRECFVKAGGLLDWEFELVEISYENESIPGYFIFHDDLPTASKTLMIMSGFDGTSEECFFQAGRAALERGYNVLLFDGPGQVGMRRFFPSSTYLPDYEAPIHAVIDHIQGRMEVDPEKLALYGISLGGYFVTRAAAYEPRLKALIANSPILDLYEYVAAMIGTEAIDKLKDVHIDEISTIPGEQMPLHIKFAFYNLLARFDCPTLAGTLDFMTEFRLGEAVENISCPCLGMVGESEGEEALQQAHEFTDNVSGPAVLQVFDSEHGSDIHCQVSNLPHSNAILFDWLDEVFEEE